MKGVEEKQPTPLTGEHYVCSRGMRYHMKYGAASGNPGEALILVSVGSEFPAGIRVQPRVKSPALAERAIQTHGHLPPIVTDLGLHEEAAADLMAAASFRLQSPNTDLVRLCLDVPGKQRSKEYYLKTIEEFFKHCQHPEGMLHLMDRGVGPKFLCSFFPATLIYLGHSEEGTGNWCFKNSTITFQEIFELYRRYSTGKLLRILSDCCYSGNWVRDCAKTLDRLGIPPCGHRAREHGILISLNSSCQPDQKATEPCHSVEAVIVKDDGNQIYRVENVTQQRPAWFNCTRLVCCRPPDSPCPRNTFQHLKWEDRVDGKPTVKKIKRKEGGADKWYYIMLHRAGDEYDTAFDAQVKADPALQLSDWGYVLESGKGNFKDIPQKIDKKVRIWTKVACT